LDFLKKILIFLDLIKKEAKSRTQEALARLVACEKSTISNWENGIATPGLSTAFRLSLLLHCDINQLFAGVRAQEARKVRTLEKDVVNGEK
jgi:transcriptional regulator with XRE-family HTH domain